MASNPLFIGMPDTYDFIFDGHAGASPSGAERWMNCTASLAATRRFLETLTLNQQASFAQGTLAARQGTTAHAAAEVEAGVALGRVDQATADATLLELTIMPEVEGEAYDDEMAEYITEYVDLVKQYRDSGREVLIEERVSATVPFLDGSSHTITGAVDCGVMPTPEEPELDVVDLKYGEGLDVDVEHNPQIRIYGLALLAKLVDEDGNLLVDIERINYVIVQPRLGGIKTWSESLDDLLDWRDEVLAPALAFALVGPEGGATYSPSDETCQWCPARGDCPALVKQRMDGAADLFDVIVEAEYADGPGSFPETGGLDDATLGKLLTQIRGLTKIAADLKDEAERRLFRGGHVPGWQLVNYSPPRKWRDGADDELDPDFHHGEESVLTPDQAAALWQRKLLSPTQALAMLKTMGVTEGDSRLAPLIEKPAIRPVVAPEGDRRKTWSGIPPEQMFPETGDE